MEASGLPDDPEIDGYVMLEEMFEEQTVELDGGRPGGSLLRAGWIPGQVPRLDREDALADVQVARCFRRGEGPGQRGVDQAPKLAVERSLRASLSAGPLEAEPSHEDVEAV